MLGVSAMPQPTGYGDDDGDDNGVGGVGAPSLSFSRPPNIIIIIITSPLILRNSHNI